jgi:hypothetical protein
VLKAERLVQPERRTKAGIRDQHESPGGSLPGPGHAGGDKLPSESLASSARGDGELGELEHARPMRNRGAGAEHLLPAERDEDLTTRRQDFAIRMLQLLLVEWLEQVILHKPGAVELRERTRMLGPVGIDEHVHGDRPRRDSRYDEWLRGANGVCDLPHRPIVSGMTRLSKSVWPYQPSSSREAIMPSQFSPPRYEPTPVYALVEYLKRKGVDLPHIRGPWRAIRGLLRRPGRNRDRTIPIVTNGVTQVAVDTTERAVDLSGFLNWCGVAFLDPIPSLEPPLQDLAG